MTHLREPGGQPRNPLAIDIEVDTFVDLAEGRFRRTTQTSLDMDMGAMTMKTISRMTMELLPNP